ncbi:MAG: manganese efflux pump [Haemophilus haemolyticus]|nr:manganese efflux pump [Haemophilus haemolyticus]
MYWKIARVECGHFLGQKFRSKAEILGGIVLIGIGISLLYEHGVFTF